MTFVIVLALVAVSMRPRLPMALRAKQPTPEPHDYSHQTCLRQARACRTRGIHCLPNRGAPSPAPSRGEGARRGRTYPLRTYRAKSTRRCQLLSGPSAGSRAPAGCRAAYGSAKRTCGEIHQSCAGSRVKAAGPAVAGGSKLELRDAHGPTSCK